MHRCATYPGAGQWMDVRGRLNGEKGLIDARKVGIAESGSLKLVPNELLSKIGGGTRANAKSSCHSEPPLRRRRIRSRITSHGSAASGFASCSTRRSSSSSSSSGVVGKASSGESSAMLSQRSSTSWSRSATGSLRSSSSDLLMSAMAGILYPEPGRDKSGRFHACYRGQRLSSAAAEGSPLQRRVRQLCLAKAQNRLALQSQRCTASTVSVGPVLKHSLA